MMSTIFCVIAGATMSVQGVINTRLSKKIGLYEANMFVQGTAFLFALVSLIFLGQGQLNSVFSVKKVYLLGGLLGLVITITVMLGMKNLSPSMAVMLILIAQLLTAASIDYFGLFETEKLPFNWTKVLGLVLMVIGVIVFKVNIKKG